SRPRSSYCRPHATHVLNDGRVASKANWRAIEELARRYDVPCLTRTDGIRPSRQATRLSTGARRSTPEAVLRVEHHRGSAPRRAAGVAETAPMAGRRRVAKSTSGRVEHGRAAR